MARVKFYCNNTDGSGLVETEIETGHQYRARVGGYGIIVIEDTMSVVQDTPIATFPDDELAVLISYDELAAGNVNTLTPTTEYFQLLTLRAVQLPQLRTLHIIVGRPV